MNNNEVNSPHDPIWLNKHNPIIREIDEINAIDQIVFDELKKENNCDFAKIQLEFLQK